MMATGAMVGACSSVVCYYVTAQGLLRNAAGAEDQTASLLISGRPDLTPEPQLPEMKGLNYSLQIQVGHIIIIIEGMFQYLEKRVIRFLSES